MIFEALRVLLFGMLGIFIVMAVIFGVIILLSRLSAWTSRRAEANVIPVEVSNLEAADSEAESHAGTDYLIESAPAGESVPEDYSAAGEYIYVADLPYGDDTVYEEVIYIDEPSYQNVEA